MLTFLVAQSQNIDEVHTIVEICNVVVLFTCFSIAINTFEYAKSNSFVFIGIVYGAVGILTAAHLITSIGWSEALPAKINQALSVIEWGHLLESISFVVAPIFFYRPIQVRSVLLLYSAITLLILGLTLYTVWLPDVFNGTKTSFAYYLDGITASCYLLAAYVNYKNQSHYHRMVFWLMMAFFGFKILTELMLLETQTHLDPVYLAAHCSNLVGYFLLYRVIAVINLRDPQKLLFFRLVKAQQRTIHINKQLKSEVAMHKQTTAELKHSVAELQETQNILRDREKLAIIGQMAAGMAHEIKNPLTSVRGFTQLLQQKSEGDAFAKRALNTMLDEVDQACRVIDDFLQLARPKPPQLQLYNVEQVITEVASLIDSQAFLKKVNTEYRFTQQPAICCIDKNQLKQVLMNLCKNALEAMYKGGKLTVCVKTNATECIISVRDTGCGISADQVDRVGVPFYTTKDHGTGLGISISHSIMKAHGGRLSIESMEGLGTTVFLHLPLSQECSFSKLENVSNVVY